MKFDIKNEWIKLNRKIVNWEWYRDIATFKLFIHCLIKVNWKDAKFKGINVKRGQFITSLNHLSDETGLSVQQVRTALDKLISTQSLSKLSFENFTIITVENYDTYQINNKVATNYQQSRNNNRRRTRKRYILKRVRTRDKHFNNNRKNYCHLNLKAKEESCIDCYKKNNCHKPTSDKFLYLHNGTSFEEWQNELEQSYSTLSKDKKELDNDLLDDLDDYDWFKAESKG